jgi:Uncharacterized conserved protein (COG2071)
VLKPFLTANWRYLAVMNFIADPKILTPFVPDGIELDFSHVQVWRKVDDPVLIAALTANPR